MEEVSKASPPENELQNLCNEYASYLKQKPLKLEPDMPNLIENMLGRLDELGACVETVKGENNKTVNVVLPILLEKTKQLQSIFSFIDDLEGIFPTIRSSVETVERKIDQTEAAFNELHPPSSLLEAFSLTSKATLVGEFTSDSIGESPNNKSLSFTSESLCSLKQKYFEEATQEPST